MMGIDQDKTNEVVKQILELSQETGLSVIDVIRDIRDKALIEALTGRINVYPEPGKIVVMSTPFHNKSKVEMLFVDDLEDDQVNIIKVREVGEYNGFRFVEDESVPPGMSPSFHHIMQKERKKKGKK